MGIVRSLSCLMLMVCPCGWTASAGVLPALQGYLIAHYDFDHPVGHDSGLEQDLGRSATALRLINGGSAMRVDDAAYPGAGRALQTRQVAPDSAGNDDWKAGVFKAGGVATLRPFNGVDGITLMGWVKPTGSHPTPDTTTADPDDRYNAVGLFGLLSGSSDGHFVRALLEVMNVAGTQRLVALGRREDTGSPIILAAEEDWQALLPRDHWTHLAATFDFDQGTVSLYRNGEVVRASVATQGDPWRVGGQPEPDLASASDPAGIKIGGSFPQNTRERNAFTGRFDDLMFLDRALTAGQVRAQFLHFSAASR
jgi:hypothetical protein